MRNMKLHTICILAFSSILTIGFEAKAQLDPNMEAGVDCSIAECMFRGNPQTRDAISGFEKLPVAGLLHRVNEYRDNPSTPVSLEQAPQFAPVGLLERDTKLADGRTQRLSGSAVIVSPCFILTNHHVAFGDDITPVPGKSYAMTFRAGKGSDAGGFAGHTEATPVVWGKRDANHREDWALMQLKNCVGTLPSFGWAEATSYSATDLVQKKVAGVSVGYSYREDRSQLSMGAGKFRGGAFGSSMLQFDGSTAKRQSGGAIFIMENGVMKLAALNTVELLDRENPGQDVVDSWTASRSNLATTVYDILNRSDVKQLLDADKANFGKSNPAQELATRPLPSSKTQMAAI